MLSNINHKLMSLACFRVLSIQKISEALWSESEKSGLEFVKELEESVDGLKIITDYLGIDTDRKDFFTGIDNDNIESLFSMYFDICILRDTLTDKIVNIYGSSAGFVFTMSQFSNIVRIISSGLIFLDLRRAPNGRRELIRIEKEKGILFLREAGLFFEDNKEGIIEIFGEKFYEHTKKLSNILRENNISRNWHNNVHIASEPVVNNLFKNWGNIQENLNRSKSLINELKKCPEGVNSWREYENICTKILYFLFVPPMKMVITQCRSEGNKERRDAIIPINKYDGFWNLIHREYGTRHIFCEFKNNSDKLSKSAINQLRIYLSKPTIGRFGLLFIRKSPSESLLQARRDAYDQNKMLILILDDEKVIEFLKSKTYLLNAEDFLENEKANFEITY